ncbi:MAG: DUF4910 domain-containing protein [Hyphomicrobiaceae bacterium]
MLTPPSNDISAISAALTSGDLGQLIYDRAANIFPICRSITGIGVRNTLQQLGQIIPIAQRHIPSGTKLYDWIVPDEWTFREAYIADVAGHRLIDASNNNLHVLNYSASVNAIITRDELATHIQTLKSQPDLIPYRTSYYVRAWGFCLSQQQWDALPPGPFHVVIDTTHTPGHLSYGEYIHHGDTFEEVLLSAHICHPSLANDNCSGLAVLTTLAERMQTIRTRYTYRFVFAPGTIGALAWLSQNEQQLARIIAGLTVSCVGDAGGPNYKKSRRGNTLIDRAMSHACRTASPRPEISEFSPYGYDERQYCSPGFNLPVGSFQRSKWGQFPEYHTSADNLNFIRPQHLAESARTIAQTIDILEDNWCPISLSPKGEPQLGQRGLYDTSPTGDTTAVDANMASLWVLNLADGAHSILDMAERSNLSFTVLASAAARLKAAGLLAAYAPPSTALKRQRRRFKIKPDQPK